MNVQYWVVYALLTVVESAISAAYWFRKFWIRFFRVQGAKWTRTDSTYSLLLHLQVRPDPLDVSSPDQVSCTSLPKLLDK